MKKMFVILVLMLLLEIMACSGGGDSQRVVISPSGGTQELSDGTKTTFDAGIVSSSTTVAINKYNSSPTSVGDATELSPTYEVEIPTASIADSTGNVNDSNTFITFEIPVQTNPVSAVIKAAVSFSSISDDAYNLSHVVIDYTSDKLHLYGNYVVQGEKAVVRVSKSTLAAAKQMATDTKVKIQTTIINVKTYFNVGETLYKVIGSNGSADFMDVTNLSLAGQGLGTKIPLIMIHGWQKSLDAEYKNPHITTWQNFINYFYSSTALQEKYMLYSYRYDSDHSIDENAQRLGEIIRDCFGDTQKVVILAHSMGGLVSHYYIQRTYDAGTINGSSRVLKLITLATPYHGSPVVQYLQGETTLTANLGIAALGEVGLALGTPGTLDLKWDNFDDNENIVINNEPLRELNKNMTHQELYFAFGGEMELSYTHGHFYEIG